jgi:hypothetical protein
MNQDFNFGGMNFEDLFGQAQKPTFKSTGIKDLDASITKVMELNKLIQSK